MPSAPGIFFSFDLGLGFLKLLVVRSIAAGHVQIVCSGMVMSGNVRVAAEEVFISSIPISVTPSLILEEFSPSQWSRVLVWGLFFLQY